MNLAEKIEIVPITLSGEDTDKLKSSPWSFRWNREMYNQVLIWEKLASIMPAAVAMTSTLVAAGNSWSKGTDKEWGQCHVFPPQSCRASCHTGVLLKTFRMSDKCEKTSVLHILNWLHQHSSYLHTIPVCAKTVQWHEKKILKQCNPCYKFPRKMLAYEELVAWQRSYNITLFCL